MTRYEVRYTQPFNEQAEYDHGGSLKPLLRKVRARIAQSIHGALAEVTRHEGSEFVAVAAYGNLNGKLRKISVPA